VKETDVILRERSELAESIKRSDTAISRGMTNKEAHGAKPQDKRGLMLVKKRDGQTVIELMFILPVFMMIIFVILEMGNIAYHTLIANHVSYELARVGAMVGVRKPSGAADKSRINGKMKEALIKIVGLRKSQGIAFKADLQMTGIDEQYKKHINEDLIVTLTYRVDLSYPLTSYIFADEPKRLGIKRITVLTRMPVERPLLASQ
jgi:hypothetical protein